MKKLLFLSILLFTINGISQNLNYKEYSYSELFQMIEAEKDSLFTLEDALIKFDIKTDSIYAGYSNRNTLGSKIKYFRNDTLIINKQLQFKNVQFLPDAYVPIKQNNSEKFEYYRTGFNQVIFKKEVRFEDCFALRINNAVFEEMVKFEKTEKAKTIYNHLVKSLNKKRIGMFGDVSFTRVFIDGTRLENNLQMDYAFDELKEELDDFRFFLRRCKISSKTTIFLKGTNLIFNNIGQTAIVNSEFETETAFIKANTNSNFVLSNNLFKERLFLDFSTRESSNGISINENNFQKDVLLQTGDLYENMKVDWQQWENKVYDLNSFFLYPNKIASEEKYKGLTPLELMTVVLSDSGFEHYKNKYIPSTKENLKRQLQLRTKFVKLYREQFELESANLVYVEYKDIETKMMQLKYKEHPTFDNFFTWRINQFLKVFSRYGTKPSRAVIFSLYVILFFAFIYLLFPNSWDKHGKNRIVNRYRFFTKYMNKEAGIHEVYLEDQQEELLASKDFKDYMLKSEKTIPSFFLKTAIPLYKWSIAGIQFSSVILKHLDIMKGSWSELPKSKRIWKSILLIGAFLIAITYDIFIKVLNALMLSINTFTTLGFGEIPIKGLPRYLAIIQGFIGWFMLTIFSVSLISQLLN